MANRADGRNIACGADHRFAKTAAPHKTFDGERRLNRPSLFFMKLKLEKEKKCLLFVLLRSSASQSAHFPKALPHHAEVGS
jgi:hypothetical protein